MYIDNLKEQKQLIQSLLYKEIEILHEGQGYDIIWKKKCFKENKFPSVEEYIKMVEQKTAALFSMMLKIIVIQANRNDLLDIVIEFSKSLGIAFQIQDDIINLSSKEYDTKGIFAEDIYEGKISLIMIYFFQQASIEDQEKVKNIIINDSKSKDDVIKCINLINKYKILDQCKEKAQKYFIDTQMFISKIQINEESKYQLLQLVEFCIQRQH